MCGISLLPRNLREREHDLREDGAREPSDVDVAGVGLGLIVNNRYGCGTSRKTNRAGTLGTSADETPSCGAARGRSSVQ
eukprot:8980004-Pyramimonas_sp.AAC.1